VNLITAHDGFSLLDLVSFNNKHNLANGENNRDGENHNNSWNHGVEGPSSDRAIQALRRRQQRNLLSTLLLSRGVPMLLMGDEVGRSQGGNNNTWCQDSPLSWMIWGDDHCDHELQTYVQALARCAPTTCGFIQSDPASQRKETAAIKRFRRVVAAVAWRRAQQT
jgi:glycogen operon protein